MPAAAAVVGSHDPTRASPVSRRAAYVVDRTSQGREPVLEVCRGAGVSGEEGEQALVVGRHALLPLLLADEVQRADLPALQGGPRDEVLVGDAEVEDEDGGVAPPAPGRQPVDGQQGSDLDVERELLPD